MRYVSLKEYIKEILKTSIYKEDSEINCIVAIAACLKGCMTQGDNFEEARDNLIDAIETWIMAGLMEGESMPIVNDVELAITVHNNYSNLMEPIYA